MKVLPWAVLFREVAWITVILLSMPWDRKSIQESEAVLWLGSRLNSFNPSDDPWRMTMQTSMLNLVLHRNKPHLLDCVRLWFELIWLHCSAFLADNGDYCVHSVHTCQDIDIDSRNLSLLLQETMNSLTSLYDEFGDRITRRTRDRVHVEDLWSPLGQDCEC